MIEKDFGKKPDDNAPESPEDAEKKETGEAVDILSREGELRRMMIQFVRTHYAKTLGKDIDLLDQPEGLEILHRKYCLNVDKK